MKTNPRAPLVQEPSVGRVLVQRLLELLEAGDVGVLAAPVREWPETAEQHGVRRPDGAGQRLEPSQQKAEFAVQSTSGVPIGPTSGDTSAIGGVSGLLSQKLSLLFCT